MLQKIQRNLQNDINVSITYFMPDQKKEGGEYITINGIVKKIDINNKYIIMDNKKVIPMDEIIEILINKYGK